MNIKSPINSDTKLQHYLSCIDYTVSRETFSLLLDETSDLLITSPQPKKEDLSKYYQSDEYISHTDSNKTVVDKIYQYVKKYAIYKKVSLINKLFYSKKKNFKILDVGCGTGDFLAYCKNKNFDVCGVEPNKNANAISTSKLHQTVFFDISELPKKTKFDVITLWHVLEHIPKLNEYISILKDLLNDDGLLIIAVPNYKSYDANHYKEYWAAYDVPRHLWHFSKKSISLLLNKFDLSVVKVLPMIFDSFYVSLLSEKYKTGKTNFIKAFFIGFKSNLSAITTKEYSSQIFIIKKRNQNL
jgi:2-polyprenyl-3-methyl-5-hydroxy-6-metoxy-1,4-benzoquinol methylase